MKMIKEILNKDKRGGPKGNQYGRKYTLNQNYFEKIDSQEKAYFLGFMYADGNVRSKSNCSRITLQKKDRKILEKFKALLCHNGFLKDTHDKKSVVLRVHSKKIKEDLIKAGCMPNKTFKLTFPDWLRENLKPHFIRGYFDGDGCVSFKKRRKCKYLQVSISGRENFLNRILDFFQIRGRVEKSRTHHTQPVLHYSSVSSIYFLNELYKDATIYLERKKKKYLDYLSYKKYKSPYNSKGKKLAKEILGDYEEKREFQLNSKREEFNYEKFDNIFDRRSFIYG